MRLQKYPWSCGAAAVVNSLRAHGITVSEERAIKATGANVNGTDEHGICRAVRYFGCAVYEYLSRSKEESWLWLHGSIARGASVILCVDEWQHWVSIIGSMGDRVVLVDSGYDRKNVREHGVHVISKRSLMRRWITHGDKHEQMYAILVRKPSKR